MNWLLLVTAILIGIAFVMSIILSIQSRTRPELGVTDGRLTPCPKTPNCVCTEPGSRVEQAMNPLPCIESPDVLLEQIKRSIEELGGKVVESTPHYLRAEFTTSLFRFVDDVEVRLDVDAGLLHFRSASRVGRSDFGTNLRRMEQFQERLKANLAGVQP